MWICKTYIKVKKKFYVLDYIIFCVSKDNLLLLPESNLLM